MTEIEKAREEYVKAWDERARLFPIMTEADRAYWAADSVWLEKKRELFALEHPELSKKFDEVRMTESRLNEFKRKIREDAEKSGVLIHSTYWD